MPEEEPKQSEGEPDGEPTEGDSPDTGRPQQPPDEIDESVSKDIDKAF